MIDAAKLIAEVEQIAAEAVPIEGAVTVVVGPCPRGCCRRLSLLGQRRTMYVDLPGVAAQVLALQLAPELGLRKPVGSSAN